MNKTIKIIFSIILFTIILFVGITTVNAAVEVTRNVYSNNGSMKFEFTGLTLDATKEYEFALTNTTAETPTKWFDITQYTTTEATVDITMGTTELREAFNKSDIGYITIREKTTNTVVVEPYQVDLKLPYMQVTNFTVINNGKEFENISETDCINITLRNNSVSEAYFQYEKITDENVINKYKELKADNGDYLELQSLIKTTAPTSNWSKWSYFNGHDANGMNGYGYPTKTITAPDTGLYYMWVYFAGKNGVKDLNGVILVDNLAPDITLESISIDKTKTIELGKTLTLTPIFNPSNATNKIVTWTSSDESVATVSNAGVVTPKKVGSTIITVTSQDGNKKATCTVTVTEATGTSGQEGTGNQDDIETDKYRKYVDFPFMITNGTGKIGVNTNYVSENYKMYYQVVELASDANKKLEELVNKYRNSQITIDEYNDQYNALFTKYSDSAWIETLDGTVKIDTSKYTGTKNFGIWVKLVTDDDTKYEVALYTINGTASTVNNDAEEIKNDKKSSTNSTNKSSSTPSKLPYTGIGITGVFVLIVVAGIAVITYRKYNYFKGIK